MSAPAVQPIPKPTTHQRRDFARFLVATNRVHEWPGLCLCWPCSNVQKFTGRGALPEGWGNEDDHSLNARARLARFIGRHDIFERLRPRYVELARRLSDYWDGFEGDDPNGEAA